MSKLLVLSLLLLTACQTPQTVLVDKHGHYEACGGSSVGSLTGGAIGYHIQKGLDEDCVNEKLAKGWKTID